VGLPRSADHWEIALSLDTPLQSPLDQAASEHFWSAANRLRLFGTLAVLFYAAETVVTIYAASMMDRLDAVLLAHDQAATLALAARIEKLDGVEPLEFLLALAAVAAFFVAMSGPRKAMMGLGRRDWKYSYGWTVATMIVPLWNFYRPWVGLGEIDRALGNAARTGRIDDSWRRDFSGATLALGLVFMIAGLLVQAIDLIGDTLPLLAAQTGRLDLGLLTDVSIVTAIAFGAITVAVAVYLARQARNLAKVALAFAIV
jgi:hypothetical protein